MIMTEFQQTNLCSCKTWTSQTHSDKTGSSHS